MLILMCHHSIHTQLSESQTKLKLNANLLSFFRSKLKKLFGLSLSSEMLQFVSNQVGEFPDLFEDQMNSAGSMQSGGTSTAPRAAIQAPQTPQTPTPPVYQSSSIGLAPSQTLSPQSLPLTPPLTPAQTTSPTSTAGQQMTRSPPLLQPRPQVVQPIQPQQAAQPTIQVSESHISAQIL